MDTYEGLHREAISALAQAQNAAFGDSSLATVYAFEGIGRAILTLAEAIHGKNTEDQK
jgi:hypothetical protein